MAFYFDEPKDPDSTVDYTFDWSTWLPTGDTISDHTITPQSGITVDSSEAINSSTMIQVWLSGGTAGNTYSINCEVTTADGRTEQITGYVEVKDK